MTIRFLGRPHMTFDVYDGPTLVGSVWKYHEGWAAFSPGQHRLVEGFFATRDEAARRLTRGRTGATGVTDSAASDEAQT